MVNCIHALIERMLIAAFLAAVAGPA